MYEKIVVPLDGSPLAEVALPYAEELAGKMGSEIMLLSVLVSEEAQEYQNHHIYATKMVEATRRQVTKYLKEPGEHNNQSSIQPPGSVTPPRGFWTASTRRLRT